MATVTSTDFSNLVDLSAVARTVFVEAPKLLPTWYQKFLKPYFSDSQQEEYFEVGVLGYAREKNKGDNVVYEVMTQGRGVKTVTPPTFALGVKFWRETVDDAKSLDFVAEAAALLVRACWSQRELRAANILNNATSTSGRYAIPNSEALAETTHTNDDGDQSNVASAADCGYSAVETLVAQSISQKDSKGIPMPSIPVLAVASSLQKYNRLRQIFGALGQQPTLIAGDAMTFGTDGIAPPVAQNVMGADYNVEVVYSPFFTGTWYALLGANHGLGFLNRDGFESFENIDTENLDFKVWVRERFETFAYKWRDFHYNAGT